MNVTSLPKLPKSSQAIKNNVATPVKKKRNKLPTGDEMFLKNNHLVTCLNTIVNKIDMEIEIRIVSSYSNLIKAIFT